MKIELDDNWVLILKRAWSMRLAILSAISATISAIMPLFDQSGSEFAILSTVLAVCAALSRVIVQPALREQLKQADDAIQGLK
jgi:multisubunit Na+/H+ antiporter MnhF subunit